jgi:hypothetical protein
MKTLIVTSALLVATSTQAFAAEIFLPGQKRTVNLRTNQSCLLDYDMSIGRAESDEAGFHSQALLYGEKANSPEGSVGWIAGGMAAAVPLAASVGGPTAFFGGAGAVFTIGILGGGALGEVAGKLYDSASAVNTASQKQESGYATRDRIELELKPTLYGIVQAHEYIPGSNPEHFPALVKLKNDTVGSRTSLDHFAAQLVLADGKRELCTKEGGVLNQNRLASVVLPTQRTLWSVVNGAVSNMKRTPAEERALMRKLTSSSFMAK